jgi:hypothetical protein
MSKITQSARNQPCTVRLPFVCNRDDSTTVFAHLSGIRNGHGTGIKTNFGAYACSSCHDALDGRVKSMHSKDYLKLVHLEAVIETMSILHDKGLVKIA